MTAAFDEVCVERSGVEGISSFNGLLTYLERLRRDCWMPTVRDGEASAPISKFGGSAWLATGEHWPKIEGEPARFLLQLDIPSLPPQVAVRLGSAGLLQLFFRPGWPPSDYPPDWAIARIVRPDLVEGRQASPPMSGASERPLLVTGWTREDDYPDLDELRHAADFDYRAAMDRFSDWDWDALPSPRVGTKIGGWGMWTQNKPWMDDAAGIPMSAVVQVSTFEECPLVPGDIFPDSGTGHVFVSKAGRGEMAFDWACC